MRFQQSVIRNVVYPLLDFVSGSTELRYLKFYEKSQWWGLDKLKQLQEWKLKRLISHAWNNVPYYRRVFKAVNMRPEDVRHVEDLEKIPILTHENVRHNLAGLVSASTSKSSLFRFQTGGTTGHPLILFKDKNETSSSMASLYRGWEWCGYEIGEKMAQIWGVPIVASRYKLLKERLRRVATRDTLIGSWNLSDDKIEQAVKRLNKEKPTFLRGYASPVYLFGRFIEKNGINLKFHLKGISTTAEPLFDFQRQTLERAFNCEVFDQYGCGEINSIGFECEEHTGLHVPIERVHVEFLDEKDNTPVSKGKTGRIVVTSLDNYGMPLIRYDTDDLGASLNDCCPCNRKLPLMDAVVGRVIDMIRLPNGDILFGGFFVIALEDMNWIEKYGIIQFQVVQQALNRIVMRIQSLRTPNARDLESFRDLVQKYVGESVAFDVEFIDEISVSASGKRRYIISEIDN
ncbi:MAG: phenylacetate--CoA ligase family protein [Candidatus Bathyarchaeota archaeon]|nr:MAG: phenylacetate--CoA ligase family protein [Candidatus Bathyarchaeota archaeon]